MLYAGLSSAKEVLLQKAIGGIGAYGNSTLKKVVGKNVDEAFSSLIKNPTVRKYLGNMVSEFGEEYLQEILEPVVRNLAYNENNKVQPFTKEALYSGMLGAVNAGILNSGDLKSNKYKTDTKVMENAFDKDDNATVVSELDKLIAKAESDNRNQKAIDKLKTVREELFSQQNSNKTAQSSIITLDEQNVAQNGLKQSENNKKNKIIDDVVNNYANSIKDNFKSSINIETNVLKTNDMSVDYKKTSQGTIVNKVKSLFSMIGKNVFKNGNQEIYVSNKDIKESIEKTLKNPSQKNLLNENMAVFSQLDKVIENGQKISDSQDTKGRENYRDWEYYVTPIVIDGKNYIVEFDTVFNADDNKRHFRLERVYDLEQTKTGLSTDFQTNSFTPRIGNNPALESTTNGILTPDFVNSSDNNIAQSDTTVNNSNMQDTENNTDENLYETMEDDTPDILMVEDAKTKNQPYLPKIKEASPKVETVTRTIDEKSTESKKQEAVTMLKDLINNSDSKVSSTHLDNLLNKYDLDYNKIYEEATKKPTRAEVNRKYNEKAEKFIQNTMAWKDKKTGFQYATET